MTAKGKPLFEKFDLRERFGSEDVTLKHLRNLDKATYVAEGSIEILREISEERTRHKYPIHHKLFVSSVFCCRKNLIEPALYAGFFETDLEHVRDALNVLNSWARLTKQE